MIEYNLENQEPSGKDFFAVALNMVTGEIVSLKNGGCHATECDFICKLWNFGHRDQYKKFNVWFCGETSEPKAKLIPKKYHKLFCDKLAF